MDKLKVGDKVVIRDLKNKNYDYNEYPGITDEMRRFSGKEAFVTSVTNSLNSSGDEVCLIRIDISSDYFWISNWFEELVFDENSFKDLRWW